MILLSPYTRYHSDTWRSFRKIVFIYFTFSLIFIVTWGPGRAIAQAVSRQLPKAAARLRSQVRTCGICGGQNVTGVSFLRVLRSALTILIPPDAPYSTFIGRLIADVPSGLSPTPPKETEENYMTSSFSVFYPFLLKTSYLIQIHVPSMRCLSHTPHNNWYIWC
jgi:hypothetical protein